MESMRIEIAKKIKEDLSVKATVDTERGQFTFYHDRINWARPQCSLFDIYLLNELNPWDYGESAPFTPAFLENDVRIFGGRKKGLYAHT